MYGYFSGILPIHINCAFFGVVHISWPLFLFESFIIISTYSMISNLQQALKVTPKSPSARVVGDSLAVVCVSRTFQRKAAQETIKKTAKKRDTVSDSMLQLSSQKRPGKLTAQLAYWSIFQLVNLALLCCLVDSSTPKRVLKKKQLFPSQPGPKK